MAFDDFAASSNCSESTWHFADAIQRWRAAVT
ncbi:uncharacterized protein ANIA_11369 [Aspergillus nidulans FGSC A4]|uniref:Uncharacterized protein n=1 Tax=Emericella nidulans (strain FGSC A4 / ATCC 38163 / CBS 112.46 / NRRL 194 / M139) TaxID=227321 RepID=C8VJG2_EMENI|nr:hypothetical protein [Aspergillus nidulans FGSC A4]CBF83926.1 TPA: hypothetical protein ANIA_11369 [Aspergillus nidulans FGSC A4]